MPPGQHRIPSALFKVQQLKNAAKARGNERKRWSLVVALLALVAVYLYHNRSDESIRSSSTNVSSDASSSTSSPPPPPPPPPLSILPSLSALFSLFPSSSSNTTSADQQQQQQQRSSSSKPLVGNRVETADEKRARLKKHLYSSFPFVPGRIDVYLEAATPPAENEQQQPESSDQQRRQRIADAAAFDSRPALLRRPTRHEFILPDLSRTTTNLDNRIVPLASAAASGALRGVVILAHTCKMRPQAWWAKDAETCPDCIGMPAERELVRMLVFHGYLPVAVSPVANRRSSGCWADGDKDVVLSIVGQVFRTMNATSGTPLFALGIANGAIFVERLASAPAVQRGHWNISAAALMNGGIWRAVDERASLYPPLLFVCMSRNADLCSHNNGTVARLNSLGAVAHQVALEPRPVTPTYFHDVGRVLSVGDSERLYASLVKSQLLWPGSGIFTEDPLFGSYRESFKRIVAQALPHIVPAVDSFRYPTSPLAQLLSLSWGFKETSDEGGEAIVDWFDSHQ